MILGRFRSVMTSSKRTEWVLLQKVLSADVHFIRAVLRKLLKKQQKKIVQLLKDSLSDPRRLQECADELEIRGFPRAADTVERFIPGLLNYRIAPPEHWRRI